MRLFRLISVYLAVQSFGIAQAQQAPAHAQLVVRAAERSPNRIPKYITGKFCEHLGANIYNGMDAQILRNPTFADFPLWSGQMNPDGITSFLFEPGRINEELRRQAGRYGWPESDIPELLAARSAGLAAFWSRLGNATETVSSPDAGPYGGRAQRLQFKAGGGIKQWVWLPLHRTRKYELELLVRSPDLTALRFNLSTQGAEQPAAAVQVNHLTPGWQTLRATLELTADSVANRAYRLELTAPSPGQLVIAHMFLRPADHINGADPDVVRFLKEAHLPLLRWPGGNFVSSYHWQDGVGPVERRPTKPNYAWGGVEPNTFGTAEFINFCQAVGCEPMICINAGTGTPEEAARWIEYCNGPVSSVGGALRAQHGHPKPFRVLHWEVGNELWGKWQANWTTAAGYVDRYQQFSRAMLGADHSIRLYACGAPVLWGKDWNDRLIQGAAKHIRSITDHPLIGGDVNRGADPLAVYRDFMYVPDILERKWSDLRSQMESSGVTAPRLAVTELQMFAHLGAASPSGSPEKLNHQNLVGPASLAEALYDTLIYHDAVRLQPFVEMVTHSATINHGGGLRKERERVYANPCHYANALFAEFAGATPVQIELQSPVEDAPLVLPEIKNVAGPSSFRAIDALAALNGKGELLLSIVYRGSAGPLGLNVQLEHFPAALARLQTLSGPEPWAANSLEDPQKIRPVAGECPILNDSLSLKLQPYSIVQVVLTGR